MRGPMGQQAKAGGNAVIHQIQNQNIYHAQPPAGSAWYRIDQAFVDGHQTADDETLRDYLEGMPCKWALVFREMLVSRPLLDTLSDAVRRQYLTVLLGAGGEGKTTLLMQTAYRLYQEGWSVWYTRQSPALLPVPGAGPDEGDEPDRRRVYIVDNAPLRDDLKAFLDRAESREWHVLMAGRTNEWNQYSRANGITRRSLSSVETPETDPGEAEAFAAYLTKQSFVTEPEEKLRELFLNNSNGFLYAAMLEAMHGKSLEEVARDILYHIDPPEGKNQPLIRLVAAVSLLETLDLKCGTFLYRGLQKYYGLKKNADKLLEKEIQVYQSYTETRHPRIARLFTRYIEEDYAIETGDLLDDFFTLYFSGRIKFPPDWIREKSRTVRKLLREAAQSEDWELFPHIVDLFIESEQPAPDLLTFILSIAPETQKHAICIKFYDFHYQNRKRIQYASFWSHWARIETERGNLGGVEEAYSARWVYRKGTTEDPAEGATWRAWGRLEEAQNNIGDSVEEAYSARWIYRQGTLEAPAAPEIWLAWGRLEETQGNIGDSVEEACTARWIYRQGTLKAPAAHDVWIAWGRLEEAQGNIGDSVEEAYTARWIYHQGTLKASAAPEIWLAWGRLEETQGNIGNSTEEAYTARWIYHQGTLKAPAASHIWLAWGRLEETQDNIGDSMEEAYTARWIYCQGTMKNPTDSSIWLAWGRLEEMRGNIGDNVEEAYTARWIYRQGTLKAPASRDVWSTWISCELSVENRIRGFQTEYTAEWIAETGRRHTRSPELLLRTVCLAIANREFEKGRESLRESMEKAAHSIRNAKKTFERGEIEAPYSWYSVDFGFLLCCELLGMDAEAASLREAFAEAGADMGQVKARCLEIWQRYRVYSPLAERLRDAGEG